MILLLLDARNRWKLFVSCLNEEQTQCRHALIKLCTNKHWISACCKQTASILIKFFRCELAAHDLRVFLSALQRGMMALIMPGSWFGGTEIHAALRTLSALSTQCTQNLAHTGVHSTKCSQTQ